MNSCVVLVDPISTGASVACEVAARGCTIIAVWTSEITAELRSHVPESAKHVKYFAEIEEKETVAETAEAVLLAARDTRVIACIVGGESGVTLADALSEELGLLTNGTAVQNRRNKNVQQKLVKASGLRAAREACGTSWLEVAPFVDSESLPVVVKPVESAGSDGVKLCHSKEEVQEHFQVLMQAQRKVGSQGAAVLVQEFLQGKEYVVDHVSRDGVHKTMMIWVYDKRPCNGADFVYFGMLPVSSDSELARTLIQYTRGVLDALGIKNGPTHGEVMMTVDGPCLVEMNCRAHGGDGSFVPLAKALTGGYSQVDVGVDSFLDSVAFAQIPEVFPSPFKATGQQVDLVSFQKGKVVAMPGYDHIRRLQSFITLEACITVGSVVDHTVDIFTQAGSVILMHSDPEVLTNDMQHIRQLEIDCGLFHLEDCVSESGPQLECPRELDADKSASLSHQCVVVVDPISTGASVACEAAARGYSVIAVWCSELTDDFRSHVPESAKHIKYLAEVEERVTIRETAEAVMIAGGDMQVIACMVGGESGVTLADALSEELSLRTNGTAVRNRRNKNVQQKLITASGLRAVREACGTAWLEVAPFVELESMPIVVKPVESAGSDGVKLCHSKEEVREHFQVLMQAQRRVGSQGAAVLLQEFLKGKEYVIDHVSRDGVHKTAMIWVYDKRPCNGADFVYFGMLPVSSDSDLARTLIEYTRGVLDALGIKNGPSHGEVMMTENGPCLVEMNCRAHGGDGSFVPLAKALTGGYSQVDAGVDSFLDDVAFAGLPNVFPCPFRESGQQVDLVSFQQGTVVSTPGYDRICKLQSFAAIEASIKVGSVIGRTVDIFTGVGSVILMHSDPNILAEDIKTIRELETGCALFQCEDGGCE